MSWDSFLFTDSLNRITGFEERRIDDDCWVGLNSVTERIPKEAAAYHDRAQSPHGPDALTMPDGAYFDMEWAVNPSWFHLSKHHHAWIPVADQKKLSTPWYYRFDRPGEIRELHDGTATFEVSYQNTMLRDLVRIKDYVRGASDQAQQSGAIYLPTPFDPYRVHEVFESKAEIIRVSAEAKRSALECLGFVNWRRSLFPDTYKYWLDEEIKEIDALELGKMPKRGILVDLERDWKQLDFTVLLKHDVPVFYRWTAELAEDSRFARFDPAILKAYHEGELTPSTSGHGYIDPEQDNKIFEIRSKLRKYDEFLQSVEVADEITYGDPSAADAKHFVVDFQGWHRREIRDKGSLVMMAEAFTARILQEAEGEVIVYTRWLARPVGEETLDYGMSYPTSDADEDPVNDPEDLHQLREFYKDPFAPGAGEEVDRWTGLSTSQEGESEGRPLLARISTSENPREPLLTRISTANTPSEPLLSRISTADASTEMDVDARESDDTERGERGRSPPKAIPTTRRETSARARDQPSRRDPPIPNSRRSRSPRAGPSGERNFESEWARSMSGNDRPRDHPRGYGHESVRDNWDKVGNPRPGERVTPSRALSLNNLKRDQLEHDREYFVRELIAWGGKMTHDEPSYRFPGNLLWNPFFIQHGYLLVERKNVEVRMRYWAATTQGIRHIREVLERAIEHHVRFRIGIKNANLEVFRPYNDEMSKIEVATAKQPHMVGFQEETLVWGLGGASFATNYIGKLGNVLRRGHAGALVPRGGPLAWIAIHYGGDMIVQKFIRGPSAGMVWHNLAESDSRDPNPIHVLYDFVSPGEESLIYGHIPGTNGDSDRWVYPTEELLEELCDHWKGEWNPTLERIFRAITKEIDDGQPRARSRTEWREYLRRSNRGTMRPTVNLDAAFFKEGERRLHAAFGHSWHQQRVWELVVPEHYVPLTRGNQGGFVRRQ
ncbi:hypothetical protein FPV67DRAFT_1665239 [Lyophyllum atratum]|nr:hypothetical protein FPV67DRAFT_1665239 [Lyophyllum atratum]